MIDIPKSRVAHITASSDWACWAPDELFLQECSQLSAKLTRHIPDGGLGCDGSGQTDIWCYGCPWSEKRYTREWFD